MGLAVFKERRVSDRRKLTGLMPGRLVLAGSDADIMCRPVDVSASGMGIVMNREIDPGTELVLKMKDRPVRLQVAWGQRDFSKHDMFRYGLVTLDPADDLERLFVETGCLR